MSRLRSTVNAHGRTTIPASIRRKLGVEPGSIVEWHHQGDAVVIRKSVGPYTSEDIRRALFPTPPRAHSLEELKEGIADYIREKHGRR